MDKEQARTLLYEYMHWRSAEWTIPAEFFGHLAAAITQAHEEEVAKMEHRYQQANQMDRDIAGMARLDMERAQAQVAVMADRIRVILGQHASAATLDAKLDARKLGMGLESVPELECQCWWCEGSRQALSAAPKVLHGLRGTLFAEGVDYGPRGAANYGDLVVLPKEGLETRVETVPDIDGRKATYLERHRHYQEVDILVLAHEPGDANYQQAKGAIPWHEGDELPEDTIARLRGRAVEESRQPSDSAEERQQEG